MKNHGELKKIQANGDLKLIKALSEYSSKLKTSSDQTKASLDSIKSNLSDIKKKLDKYYKY